MRYYLSPINSPILPYCNYNRVHLTQNNKGFISKLLFFISSKLINFVQKAHKIWKSGKSGKFKEKGLRNVSPKNINPTVCTAWMVIYQLNKTS